MSEFKFDENVELSLHMAGRIRSGILARFPEEPLPVVFTALLLVAAEVAHSQGMSNIKFRQTARDVYRAAAETVPEPGRKVPECPTCGVTFGMDHKEMCPRAD